MASKPKALAGIGGALVVLAAAFFGLDLGDGGGTKSATQPTATPTAKASQAPKPAAPKTPAKKAASETAGQCPVDTLPDQVDPVIEGIVAGKQPKYPDNDGVRFGNYEGVLPRQDRNYYREYTVDTPGLNHRGERRIITGGGSKTDPDVWYYTDNHYESFCEIPDAE
ncbi:ribonuclease domain-containing protein [Corynebacterium sp. H127]|uniref:ribonuclease domain-containing protein n=1 Tax=Corynebacterium sp. H127 TaxID=3133418 RepID=UPI003097AC1A